MMKRTDFEDVDFFDANVRDFEILAAGDALLETDTTTTLGHDARGDSTVGVFWGCWNRCMRILSDAQCRRWPSFASRVVLA
jgi:hypothetical protein